MSHETIQDIPEVNNKTFPDVIIKKGHGTRAITETFGINEQYLRKIPDLGTIRTGDRFTFTKNPDGSGILRKIRDNVEVGERKINHSYIIPKEAFIVDTPNVGVDKKISVRDFLTDPEKSIHDDIFDTVRIGQGSIEYKGNQISLNVKPGNEKIVQLLLAQMIIRGIYDQKKGGMIHTIREKLGDQYYENDHNDIDAKNGYLLDTTIVTRELLFQLFDFKNKTPGIELQAEQRAVTDLLVNFLNGVVKQEMTNKTILAKR